MKLKKYLKRILKLVKLDEMEILPPLIEYDESGNYTKEIYEIYGSEK